MRGWESLAFRATEHPVAAISTASTAASTLRLPIRIRHLPAADSSIARNRVPRRLNPSACHRMVIRLDYDRVAMLNRFRQFWTKVITPIANLLLKLGVSADAVTLVGTIGVSAGALIFFPRGQLWLGVVVITCFVFSDMIDGHMARTSGTSSKWGSFLDSTLDRLADGAIYGGLVMYYANSGAGDSTLMAAVTLWALVMGAVTSYARAKAESLGLKASGGLAERADRLVFTLIVAFFSDVLNLPILLEIVIWAVAVASTITVIQRCLGVRKQVLADPANAGLDTPPPPAEPDAKS